MTRLLLWFVIAMFPDSMAQSMESKVEVSLNSFIAHGDGDPWGRSVGLTASVINNGDRPVSAMIGYDGKNNYLLSDYDGHGISLVPVTGFQTKSIKTKHHWLAPGERANLFTLPMHEILRRGDQYDDSRWRWTWFEKPPRNAPPMSPVHPLRGPGWQAWVFPSASLSLQAVVDGKVLRSPPLQFNLNLPNPSLANQDKSQWVRLTSPIGTPLIEQDDLIAYHWPSHSFRLRAGLIQSLREKLSTNLAKGVPIQLRVGDRVLFEGSFGTRYDSRRISGVVVFLDGNEVTTLEWNEPESGGHRAMDPRNDRMLESALTKAGLLLR